ncbi:tail fiber domain-containing protein [Citrobacter freundii]|uniref:tail fiber domain-containing protein n=1 Tax=Citrobacter freundii TaxID=546 RepID=UPI00214DB1E8|nr:tail fiber domain-containing protein [Citrobacter freundii]MCR3715436.1 tail fiber domain-containing protein [Citrobacter freundii]
MSAGTLTLTNNSAAVSGSGTAFTTELAAGDFIVVTVGGIPYTLPVKTVNSNTSATLVSNFTGPTQSGAAWYAVPRIALNLVTAEMVVQNTQALLGLNYDKQNWQSVFSGTGTVTVRLPDGSTFTGPAWGGIASTLSKKAASGENSDITGLSGLTTPLSTGQGGTGRSDGKAVFTRVSAVDNRDASLIINATGFPADRVGGMVLIQCTSSSGNPYIYVMRTDGGSAGQITCKLPDTSGVLAVQGTSGRDYKDDIKPADPQEALDRVMGLDLVNFVYKDDEQRRVRFGFIAEDAETGAPQYIKHREFPVPGTEVYDEEGVKISEQTEDRPAVDNNPIVMDLLGCVQALQQQIAELKTTLSSITAQ